MGVLATVLTAPIKVHSPRRNLGCFGVSLGDVMYGDVFIRPHLGTFLRTPRHVYRVRWVTLTITITECHCPGGPHYTRKRLRGVR